MKIRNARQYQDALDKLDRMELVSVTAPAMLPPGAKAEMFNLANAVEAYELTHAQGRDYVGRK